MGRSAHSGSSVAAALGAVRQAGASAVHLRERRSIDARFVSRAHRAGMAIRPWVINEETDLERMFRAGVDALFTDLPRVAMTVR